MRLPASYLTSVILLCLTTLAASQRSARAETPFDAVLETAHHVGLTPADGCVICHTDGREGQIKPDLSGETPRWVRAPSTGSFTLYPSPDKPERRDYHPFGPSSACMTCHDGALALDVHGVGAKREARYEQGRDVRPTDHPDSIPYPRTPTGILIGAGLPPQLRYWSVPDRQREALVLPTGPASPSLYLASGLTPTDQAGPALLVRTTKGWMHCDSCHNPHVATFPPFLRASPKSLCLVCHDR